MRTAALALVLWLGLGVSIALGAQIRVASFNVESGGADPNVVDDLVADASGIDIWGFSEVQNQNWASIFETAAETGEGANFEQVFGTTGGGDRLVIIFDADRFELVNDFELSHINVLGRVRAPLVAHLRERSDGFEFLFMVNHLYRSRANRRHEQSQLLNEWAQNQTLPIIAAGDYNYDWSVTGGDTDHDAGYDLLTANSVFTWVRPAELIKTHCSHHDSVLDFVFLAGDARSWTATSEILPADPSYCPDDGSTSDHRMVFATLDTNNNDSVKQQILDRIEQLEDELSELRTLVQTLP